MVGYGDEKPECFRVYIPFLNRNHGVFCGKLGYLGDFPPIVSSLSFPDSFFGRIIFH